MPDYPLLSLPAFSLRTDVQLRRNGRQGRHEEQLHNALLNKKLSPFIEPDAVITAFGKAQMHLPNACRMNAWLTTNEFVRAMRIFKKR